jgi:hypothetical protein
MRKGLLVSLAVLIIICFSGSVSAAWSPRLEGRPDAFDPGNSRGYFIWQDADGLHLRTTTPGTDHVFSGIIRTDGFFEDVWGRSRGGDDSLRVSRDRDKVSYRFVTSGGVDGVDFRVYGGSYVRFELAMDGDDIDPANIYIGGEGWHPGSPAFTFRPDYDRDRYSGDRTVIIVNGYHWWHFRPYYWDRYWHNPWHRW